MFQDLHADYDAFFEYGIGAMCWRFDPEDRRMLYFIAPGNYGVSRIYTKRSETDWTVPGDVDGWDGNLERPTFQPSIWLIDRKGWHGFIREGNLVTV